MSNVHECEFGRRLRRARLARGIKSDKMAAMVDVHTREIFRWENTACLPNLIVGSRVAKILGMTLDEMVGKITVKRRKGPAPRNRPGRPKG